MEQRKAVITNLPAAIVRLTLPDAKKRLSEAQAILSSDEHYQATPSRNYGDLDPLDSLAEGMQPCCACGKKPELKLEIPKASQLTGVPPNYVPRSRRWFASCVCGIVGPALKEKHLACGAWNRSGLAIPLAWKDFPFMGVVNLAPDVAKQRLSAIKDDLDLRLQEAYLRLRVGDDNPPGPRFVASLSAYREWALYGLWLLLMRGKTHRNTGVKI